MPDDVDSRVTVEQMPDSEMKDAKRRQRSNRPDQAGGGGGNNGKGGPNR